MQTIVDRNMRFLRNIYEKGPFQGHGFAVAPAMQPAPGGDFTLSDRPVAEWVPWLVEGYRDKVNSLQALGDDSVPYARIPTGAQIYAAAFGTPIRHLEEGIPTPSPLAYTAEEADALQEPDIWKSPSLYRVFEMAQALEKELGRDVPLGPPNMQTGFNTAGLVWNKEALYCAMLDNKDRDSVHRLVGKCARLLKTFLTELRREFPQMSPLHCPEVWCPPEGGPWISNDECGSISVRRFEEFCLPELIDLAATYGGLGMHCCADAEHQFSSFRKIPNLYGFNRVPGRYGYEPVLKRLAGASAPTLVLARVDPATAAWLIEEAPPGTRFIFNHIGSDSEGSKVWLEKMRTLSPRTD